MDYALLADFILTLADGGQALFRWRKAPGGLARESRLVVSLDGSVHLLKNMFCFPCWIYIYIYSFAIGLRQMNRKFLSDSALQVLSSLLAAYSAVFAWWKTAATGVTACILAKRQGDARCPCWESFVMISWANTKLFDPSVKRAVYPVKNSIRHPLLDIRL